MNIGVQNLLELCLEFLQAYSRSGTAGLHGNSVSLSLSLFWELWKGAHHKAPGNGQKRGSPTEPALGAARRLSAGAELGEATYQGDGVIDSFVKRMVRVSHVCTALLGAGRPSSEHYQSAPLYGQ